MQLARRRFVWPQFTIWRVGESANQVLLRSQLLPQRRFSCIRINIASRPQTIQHPDAANRALTAEIKYCSSAAGIVPWLIGRCTSRRCHWTIDALLKPIGCVLRSASGMEAQLSSVQWIVDSMPLSFRSGRPRVVTECMLRSIKCRRVMANDVICVGVCVCVLKYMVINLHYCNSVT